MTTYTPSDKRAIANLNPGMTVWKVHAFVGTKSGDVTEYLISGLPYVSNGALFIEVAAVDFGYSVQSISLMDAGFPRGNNYNDHKLFFSKFDADQYLADVVAGRVISRKNRKMSDDFDYGRVIITITKPRTGNKNDNFYYDTKSS